MNPRRPSISRSHLNGGKPMHEMPDAIILCGGAGSRLKSVIGDSPKAMAPIMGHPFLELLLRQLRRHSFTRVILAVGYQKDIIRNYFGTRAFGLHLVYSEEEMPLGTGGALGNAAGLMQSDTALVTNGDSYTDLDLSEFLADHRAAGADVSLVVVPNDSRGDCGMVSVNLSGRVERYAEREPARQGGHINAGLYLVPKALLRRIPPRVPISIENQLLPQWLQEGSCVRAFVSAAECVDIGTPDRYHRAQCVLAHCEVEGIASR